MNLRPYQIDAVNQLRQKFAQGFRSVILCLPTGGGKTVVFTTIAKAAIEKGSKIMIVCDRKELISQAYDNILRLGLNPTIIAPGFPQHPNNCYLASVDTLRRRELPEVDIVIIDEAHKQTFDSTIDRYQRKPIVIGATATPVRTGNQESLHLRYDTIVETANIATLLEEGYLVNARTFAAKKDFSNLKITGGDYNNKALYYEFNKVELYDGLINQFEKFARTLKTIVFNVNVEHSKNTVAKFIAAGYSAKHLDGKTPAAERRQILADFKAGKFQVLSNCSVLTTGYDEPSIECVIVNRATMSLPLWLQMIGRGSRIFPNKETFTIIDMGGNVYKHGLYDNSRSWELEKPKRKKDGIAPVKLCEKCEAMNHASARFCSECERPFPIKEKKLLRAEFVEIKSNRGATKKPKTEAELKEYAKKMGYNPKWVYVQMKLLERN